MEAGRNRQAMLLYDPLTRIRKCRREWSGYGGSRVRRRVSTSKSSPLLNLTPAFSGPDGSFGIYELTRPRPKGRR
jgi:hypothetical protein